MNRFMVGWRGEALQELAEIWLESDDRDAVVAATRDVDAELAQRPLEKSKEISEGLYRIDVLPLRVYFTVSIDDCKVEIVKVRGMS